MSTKPAPIALADTLFRVPRQPGITPLQLRKGSDAGSAAGSTGANLLSSWRLLLAPGEGASFVRHDEEVILILERGQGELQVGAESFTVSRQGIFAEPATALYLPPGQKLSVRATSTLEAILVSAPAEAGVGDIHLVTPETVRVVPRGRGQYAREVHDIFVADPHPQRLMVGETFNPPGNWSSFPPHKHDGLDGEPYLEEVYVYAIDPPTGFGQQILYQNGEDGSPRSDACVAHVVRDGDAVLLPFGYHPVAAPPGYRLRYLWVLAGDERRLSLYEDPAHRWIHDHGSE